MRGGWITAKVSETQQAQQAQEGRGFYQWSAS
jgi:hypothetical protein